MMLKSSITQMNEILGGYYTADDAGPYAIYAKAAEGKTIYVLQEGVNLASQMKKGIIWIDSEGGIKSIIDVWCPIFNKRFEYEPKVLLLSALTIESMLKLHGIDVATVVTGGKKEDSQGKREIVFKGMCENQMMKTLRSGLYGVVIYDSISAPLASLRAGGPQSLDCRATATNLWREGAQMLCENFNMVMLTTHHPVGDNPINPYSGKVSEKNVFNNPTLYAGKAIKHWFKEVLFIQQQQGNAYRSLRKIWVVRHGNLPEWQKYAYTKLTDSGYVDISRKEVEEMAVKTKEEVV